ncbi:MAG TPA: cyclic pyranopterin monophosphate synthase MoaC [Chthoniobacterales bacterium]|jgi:cyclic pyranopterin phosphate synthase
MSTGSRLTHLDAQGAAQMVDIGSKPVIQREAVAAGAISLSAEVMELIRSDSVPKGNVLAVARVAAIQAVKNTAALIPLCHTLPIDAANVDFVWTENGLSISCTVRTTAKTGVEMEALTGVSVAALTIYDMCKAVDKEMRISDIHLVSKTKKPLPITS